MRTITRNVIDNAADIDVTTLNACHKLVKITTSIQTKKGLVQQHEYVVEYQSLDKNTGHNTYKLLGRYASLQDARRHFTILTGAVRLAPTKHTKPAKEYPKYTGTSRSA